MSQFDRECRDVYKWIQEYIDSLSPEAVKLLAVAMCTSTLFNGIIDSAVLLSEEERKQMGNSIDGIYNFMRQKQKEQDAQANSR